MNPARGASHNGAAPLFLIYGFNRLSTSDLFLGQNMILCEMINVL